MSSDPNDISKGFKLLSVVWPVIAAVAVVFTAGVRVDAKAGELERRTTYLELNGSPPIVARLSRIEERQLVLIQAVERIEQKLDEDRRGRVPNVR